jgi:hypothetical protein
MRHLVLTDPLHEKDYPRADICPSVTHVTKTLPVALLRTCHSIHDEAQPFTDAKLRNEPSRYLFDHECLHTFVSTNFFNIFHVIRHAEDRFLGQGCAQSLADALHEQRSLEPKSDIHFSSLGSMNILIPITLTSHDAGYTPLLDFMVKCAHWNVSTRGEQFDASPIQPLRTLHYGIKIPADYTEADEEDFLDDCGRIVYWCRPMDRYSLCLFVQPGRGEKQQRNAALCRKLEQRIARYAATFGLVGTKNALCSVEQPSVEMWEAEWEGGVVF